MTGVANETARKSLERRDECVESLMKDLSNKIQTSDGLIKRSKNEDSKEDSKRSQASLKPMAPLPDLLWDDHWTSNPTALVRARLSLASPSSCGQRRAKCTWQRRCIK